MSDLTELLAAVEQDPLASEQLLPLVYAELRQLAAQRMAHEKPGQTLQTTALVHEAYVRLVAPDQQRRWDSRGHFFAAAAEAMRRILVENARRRSAQKRGRRGLCFEVSEGDLIAHPTADELLDLNEALTRLEQADQQTARIVQLRVFGGMTFAEVAAHLRISVRTAKRHWAYARAWLGREMGGSDGPSC